MKAIIKSEPAPGVSLADMPEPAPGPGEVLFAPEITSVCGSDVTMDRWEGWAPRIITEFPFVLGHECCGRVLDVGKEVAEIRPGDRISVETHISCGSCWYCRNGRAHVCARMVTFGVTANGCFAEQAVVSQRAVWKVDPEIQTEHAALLEPLGVALRAADTVSLQGLPVAIVGAGPIGLLAATVASTRSPDHLIVIEPNPSRRALARAAGANLVVDPGAQDPAKTILELTDGVGVEVVIECSGHPEAILKSIDYTRTGGHLVQVGNAHAPVAIDVTAQIIMKELQIHGVWGRRLWESWEAAERFLIDFPSKIAPLITKTYALSDGLEAFVSAGDGHEGKILIRNEP